MLGSRDEGGRWSRARGFGWPGLAVGLLVGGWLGSGTSPRLAAQPAPPGQVPGLIALTAETPGNPNGSLLYLIDSREQSFAIYRVDALQGTVKLEAARHFRADMKVSEYNNQPPTVASVEAMVAPTRGGAGPKPN